MSETKMPIASITRKDVTHRLHRKGIWEGEYRLRIFCTDDGKCIFYNDGNQYPEDERMPVVLYMPDVHAYCQRLIANDDDCEICDFCTWVGLRDQFEEDAFLIESDEKILEELDRTFENYAEVVPDNEYTILEYEHLYALFDKRAFEDFEDEIPNKKAESPFSLFNCRRQDFDGFCECCKEYNIRHCARDDLKRGRCLTIWSQCELEKQYDSLMKIKSAMK